MWKRLLFSLSAAIATLLLALVLGVSVLNPGTLSGPTLVAISIWPAMLFAALICIWSRRPVSRLRKWTIWTIASVVGVGSYLAAEALGGMLFASGQPRLGLDLGVLSDLPALIAACVVTAWLLRRSVPSVAVPDDPIAHEPNA